MENLVRERLSKFFKINFIYNTKFVFIFFIALVFVSYYKLFFSYFEADEWPAFAANLPLTSDPWGFLKVLFYQIGDSASLAKLQHIVPIGIEIFFLNTLFFGVNFFPYAFISLCLHALNSFLVFIFIRLLIPRKYIFAILGGVFFALSPVHMHAVTWAATYPVSVLPVTLSLLCLIFFKLAFNRKNKKFLYYSIIFLFLALLTKETSFFLFIALPIIALFEKRIFGIKFLGKLFLISLTVYVVLRFLIPGIYFLPSIKTQKLDPSEAGTIVSKDLSIYPDLRSEVFSRVITFPVRMMGTIFLPRQTLFSVVEFLTPIVTPMPPGSDTSSRSSFLYGTGNFLIIYLVGTLILALSLSSIINFIKRKKNEEARSLMLGTTVIVLNALILVLIIFSFPRWGYDFYFDSRYYYPAGIGASILFPFLIFGLAEFISKNLYIKNFSKVVLVVFIIWFVNNMYVFGKGIQQFTQNFANDRKEIVSQLRALLPILPTKTVFYFETDGKSAFGPNLPFFTSVPQALTVVYYDKSPLPDSFFSKPLFDRQPHGYQYDMGRGFGYYNSREELLKAIKNKKFSPQDVYAFYYYAKDIKLKNITSQFREELQSNLEK